jgi:hypothetical protein
VSNELLLAGIVRKWAEDVWADEPAAADGAVNVAMRCYAGGASVSEACREARSFLKCWVDHPAHVHLSLEEPVLTAS